MAANPDRDDGRLLLYVGAGVALFFLAPTLKGIVRSVTSVFGAAGDILSSVTSAAEPALEVATEAVDIGASVASAALGGVATIGGKVSDFFRMATSSPGTEAETLERHFAPYDGGLGAWDYDRLWNGRCATILAASRKRGCLTTSNDDFLNVCALFARVVGKPDDSRFLLSGKRCSDATADSDYLDAARRWLEGMEYNNREGTNPDSWWIPAPGETVRPDVTGGLVCREIAGYRVCRRV